MASEYDPSRDELQAELLAVSQDKARIMVQIYSYNGGERKIQISRQRKDKFTGDFMPAKLGRLGYEEFAKVAQAVRSLKDKGAI